jgi:dTMP kinase
MVRLKKQGKLIVLEGTDGSGKTTQFKLLIRRLKKEGIAYAILDFPQYDSNSSYFVKRYLRGDYGGWTQVGPYKASIFYALDRFDARAKIDQWLREGRVVVADRYMASNMGHQGAKISSPMERVKFFRWLAKFEFDLLGIARPDATIVLHVSASLAKKMIDRRRRITGNAKASRAVKRDIHEADLKHLKAAEGAYRAMARTFPKQCALIECASRGKFLEPEKIHEKVWKEVKRVIG